MKKASTRRAAKRFGSVVLAAVLALGVAATTTAVANAAPTQRAQPAAVGYQPPPIAWGSCSDPDLAAYGAQCGFLIVPLNYADPSGTKIEIAVSRALHTSDAARYQGVMLVNPGGPGGSGLGLATLQQYVPKGVGFDYDWIGFDPRGVGSSRPSLTCNSKFFHGDRPPYDITQYKSEPTWVARSKRYAAQCASAPNSALFNHVKTTDSVKDMESLRKALGVKQINYYGFSYGTYLGQVYMTLHPNRVRRFVLDGTVDPRGVWYRDNQDQDVAFERTTNIYFGWLAKYDSVYHVGKTKAQARALYYAAVAKLNIHAADGILGGDELTDVFTSAGYYVFGWEDIANAWSAYINHGDASGLIAMYQGANPTSAGGDNGYALYLGTQCTDTQWPTSQAKIDRDNIRLNRDYPFLTFSNEWFNGPCAYWHFKAGTPVTVTGKNVTSKILMINETFDAATPYSGSLYVRKIFPTASLVEGKDGTTHAGSLFGVACTDNTIARYLATGRTPTRQPGNQSDKVCPPNPQPNPTADASSAAVTAKTSGSAELQRVLAAAKVRG